MYQLHDHVQILTHFASSRLSLPPSVAVTCPAGTTGTVPGTSGTGGTSGCTYGTVPGYSGTGVTAITEDPFFITDVEGRSVAATTLYSSTDVRSQAYSRPAEIKFELTTRFSPLPRSLLP